MAVNVTVTEDVTLIVLHHCPAEIGFIDIVFSTVSEANINVDMISVSPPQGDTSTLSFTIADNDLTPTLSVIKHLRNVYSEIKSMISSGNSKIQISCEEMRTSPGFASLAFKAASQAGADIRLITTSEIEISLLVTKADEKATYLALKDQFLN
ncbi:MAG: hypothetical protein BGN88_01025 [Clostridiales bacterium 43-6]|nr:MAG: hypothetical protein BGN88_01025 [Clostridiales bacterium 43-6]